LRGRRITEKRERETGDTAGFGMCVAFGLLLSSRESIVQCVEKRVARYKDSRGS
jgi:hypothetical protein